MELNDSTHVFLMGTNTGHGAMINFIKANEDRAQDRLTKVVSFIEDVPLQSCKSATDDQFPAWYYRTSLVFIANDHGFWRSEYASKIKKRFGRVYKSGEDSISDMLVAHKDVVINSLLEETRQWRSTRPVTSSSMEMGDDNASLPIFHSKGLPPVGNFALSQRSGTQNGNLLSPKERTARSPRVESPPKVAPVGAFALSPRRRF